MRLWRRYVYQRAGAFDWFVAAERGAIGGRVHLHGLANFDGLYTSMEGEGLRTWWRSHYGIADVRTFRNRGGAGLYCAKYVTKDTEGGAWDLEINKTVASLRG